MADPVTTTEPKFRGRATIRDIADLAGVSIATVSRVLNDRPDVARETRETVLQVVREHGFSTNRGARGLSSGRTGMIGLTLPLVNDLYFGPMLSGASEALYEADMRIVLCPTHARARPRGLAARPADARHHRRRDPGAAGGVGGRASHAQAAGLPLRRRRPARPAARRNSVCLGDARGGLEAGDRASARARPPPDRRDRRQPRLVRHRGAHDRLPGRAGRRGDPAGARARRLLRLAHAARHRGRRAAALAARATHRDLRLQRQRRDSGRSSRRASAACPFRTISPSSDSTTPSRRRSSRHPSRPCASRWPSWAGWASAS